MVDGNYVGSLLGCANLIELTLLAGGFIAVRIASTSYAQLTDSYPNNIQDNISRTDPVYSNSFYAIDSHLIKQAAQAIFLIIFCLTFLSFLAHIVYAFRYRYSWHRLSTSIAFLCVIYAFALFAISVLVSCWEDKVRKRLNSTYLSTLNSSTKTGSAAAAATFGFAACLIYLSEALIRFRRLADKIQA